MNAWLHGTPSPSLLPARSYNSRSEGLYGYILRRFEA